MASLENQVRNFQRRYATGDDSDSVGIHVILFTEVYWCQLETADV